MKLMQLNIWGGKLSYVLTDFLEEQKPDILCMQEVNDLKGPSGGLFATLDEIKDAAGTPHSFMSPTYSHKYMERSVGFGNAIVSNLPFTSTKTVFTEGNCLDNFDVCNDDYNVRNVQIASLKHKDKSLFILNHHGHHIPGYNKDGDEETTRQMKIIDSELQKLEGPIIATGDFNVSPISTPLKIINSRLTNLPLKYKLKRSYTSLSGIYEVCDYIFVNEPVKIKMFRALDDLVSDHKALVLEFDI